MIHLCLFGGQGGQLSAEKKVYLTLFGGCDLRWPTIAKQMVDMRQSGQVRHIFTHTRFYHTLRRDRRPPHRPWRKNTLICKVRYEVTS